MRRSRDLRRPYRPQRLPGHRSTAHRSSDLRARRRSLAARRAPEPSDPARWRSARTSSSASGTTSRGEAKRVWDGSGTPADGDPRGDRGRPAGAGAAAARLRRLLRVEPDRRGARGDGARRDRRARGPGLPARRHRRRRRGGRLRAQPVEVVEPARRPGRGHGRPVRRRERPRRRPRRRPDRGGRRRRAQPRRADRSAGSRCPTTSGRTPSTTASAAPRRRCSSTSSSSEPRSGVDRRAARRG